MKGEFLRKETIKPRELHGWKSVDYDKNFIKDLLASLTEDYKGKYELEGEIEELKESLEESKRTYVNMLLRILEVVDFWERIIEVETTTDPKIERFISGYKFLLDELAKIKPDGPEVGKLPRSGKDVVEGMEERTDLPRGVICGIIKKCYLLEDRVLRKARVITVK